MPEEHVTPEAQTASQPTPQPARTPRASWKQNAGIPVAIVIGAVFIAGSIYMSGNRGGGSVNIQNGIDTAQNVQNTPEMDIAPVSSTDHIRGNPNAPIMIVEYSDYDCPFCRVFHDTMNEVMDRYGEDGKVAWVYRNFPIVQLHPNAPKISEASYCVTEQTGNDGFWKFTDALNASRKVEFGPNGQIQSVEPTDMTRIAEFASAAGVDKAKFELCYNSGKYKDQVAADVVAAGKAGAQGTPHSVVLIGDQKGVLSGAQPLEVMTQVIDNLLSQMGGGA